MTFALGQQYTLSGWVLWNCGVWWDDVYYNERGINSVDLSFSTNGVDFGSSVTFTPTIAPETGSTVDAQTFALSNVQATHVKFSNMGGPTDDRRNFGEVRFTLISEPATWVLLTSGLFGLGRGGVGAGGAKDPREISCTNWWHTLRNEERGKVPQTRLRCDQGCATLGEVRMPRLCQDKEMRERCDCGNEQDNGKLGEIGSWWGAICKLWY